MSGAEKSSNFFWGFLALPRRKREALAAVYAYCRLIDDIVDELPPPTIEERLPKEAARRQLDFWNQEIDRLYSGAPTHDVALRLAPFIKEFPLPKQAFHEMVRGCRMDLDGVRYRTPEELESYMAGVASSVGEMSVAIFAPEAAQRLQGFARQFGFAFQLTNIIRDVGADLKLGRVYLPQSDLDAAGCRAPFEYGRAFHAVMLTQYARAKDYYRTARALVEPRDRAALLPAEIMGHMYEGLLDHIKAGDFRVLDGKQRLPGWRKALQAGRALLYCHG